MNGYKTKLPNQIMNIMKTKLFLFLLLLPLSLSAQGYEELFIKAFQTNDTLSMKKVINLWQQAQSNDPELYTAKFNYYVYLAQNRSIEISYDEPEGEYTPYFDSINNLQAYLIESISFNPLKLEPGITIIDSALALYPNRLDLYFGKIYVFGESNQYERQFYTALQMLEQNKKNPSDWLWYKNETIDNVKEFFLSNVQSFLLSLFEIGSPDLLAIIRDISMALSEQYPQETMPLANIGSSYAMVGDYEQALTWFLKADKLQPNEVVILVNLARLYELTNKRDEAMAAYQKILIYGDSEHREYANQNLQRLK